MSEQLQYRRRRDREKSRSGRRALSAAVTKKATLLELVRPAAPAPGKRVRLHFAIGALLVVVTCAVYFRATKNPFVNYDDQGYVVENLHVQQGLTEATVRWAFTATGADNWHPLTWLSHALDCQLFGLKPAGHHSTSIALHALNAGILFLLLATATGKPWRSLAVAALFALHPMNVESVAWIAERKNVLSMFFLLLTLSAYGWHARKPKIERYMLVVLLFALGLMAKPMIVTLPFALLLVDFWPLHRALPVAASAEFPVRQYRFSWLVVEKLPLIALAAASSAITVVAQRGAIAPNQNLPFLARVLNAIYAYSEYIIKAFWPAHLASFYPYEGIRLGGWRFLLSLFVLVAGSWWAWHERSRFYPPAGWLWFLGTLVPMIGIVQVGNQAMADRYAYLSLIGIFCIVVWRVADFAEEQNLGIRPLAMAGGVVLVLLSLLTWRQIGYWDSSYDLWSHALRVTKDNFMAEDYVGSALLLRNYGATGQRYSEDALIHFQNAVRINPDDPISHLNLGADLHEHGRLAEAIEQYKIVLALTEDQHLVLKALIDLGAASHQSGDLAAARQYYREALKLEPRNQVVFENIGKLAMDERIQQLSAAASAHPTAEAYLQLGQVQEAASHVPDARASFEAALRINPKFSDAKAALEALNKNIPR